MYGGKVKICKNVVPRRYLPPHAAASSPWLVGGFAPSTQNSEHKQPQTLHSAMGGRKPSHERGRSRHVDVCRPTRCPRRSRYGGRPYLPHRPIGLTLLVFFLCLCRVWVIRLVMQFCIDLDNVTLSDHNAL